MTEMNLPINTARDKSSAYVSSLDIRQNKYHKPPRNRLPISITAAIVGFLSVCMCWVGVILGAIAIIFATQSTTKYNREDYMGAESSSQVALVLSVTSLVISFISVLILLFFYAIYGISDISNIPLGINSTVINHLY